MEQYFPSSNTKGKQVQNKDNEGTSKRKNVTSDDNPTDKKIKTASAPNPQWLATHEWLEFREIEDTVYMFCKWCEEAKFTNQLAKGTSVYRKETINRHLKVKDHLIAEKIQCEDSNNIIVGFAKQYDKDKVTVIQQMRCVYFVAKNYISFNVYPKLCHLVKLKDQITTTPQVLALPKQIMDNTISTRSSYGTYANNNSGKMLERSIVNVIKQELICEIKNSPFWSIMIDETTSIADEKHLAIVSKHMSYNVSVLRFIGLIELEDCTASNIFEQILGFIQINELNLDKLIHFGSDSASTMVGK
jgi:Domain of unknown function (DUF4371)